MDSQSVYDTCSVLAERLPRCGWALTGGASFVVRGLSDFANDVDVLATRECAQLAASLLSEFQIRPLSQSQNGNVRSLFAVYMIEGNQTEIMADVFNQIRGCEWHPHTGWINHVEFLSFRSLTLPLLALQYEARIAKMLEQPSRIKLIENAEVGRKGSLR